MGLTSGAGADGGVLHGAVRWAQVEPEVSRRGARSTGDDSPHRSEQMFGIERLSTWPSKPAACVR